jgi:hypothetical protein
VSNQNLWIPGAIPFFLFGLLYYLISPILVFPLLSRDNEVLSFATGYLVDSYFDSSYALDVLFIFLSFFLGYSATKSATSRTLSTLDYCSSQAKSPLYFALALLTLIIYFLLVAVQTGVGFFTGYSDYDVYVLGAFSTIVFLSVWFVNFFSAKHIRYLFLTYFILCSVLLLGWGSRMFFVLSFTALSLGFISHHRRLLKSVLFYVSASISGIFIVFVGVLREGGTELNSDKFLGILFAEPLFSAVSGFLFLENSGGRPTYNIPHGLYASVIHFVPSFLFPGKTQLIDDILFNENVMSPFGGTALIVNLYSNFGMLYPIFVAAIGSYYGFLFVKSQDSIFYRSVYFSALPVLLFLFYRDGMTTVLKVLFFNGLIVPYIVAKSLNLYSTLSTPDGFRKTG